MFTQPVDVDTDTASCRLLLFFGVQCRFVAAARISTFDNMWNLQFKPNSCLNADLEEHISWLPAASALSSVHYARLLVGVGVLVPSTGLHPSSG